MWKLVRRVRGSRVILLVALLLGIGTGVAWANNTHTVGHIYHGVGDGTNDNYYIHNFDDVTDGHTIRQMNVDVWHAGIRDSHANCFTCQHLHISWDTSPRRECKYYGQFATLGRDSQDSNHNLNPHFHYHHNYCP